MVRKILAVIAGLITFYVVVSGVQMLNGIIFGAPPPETMTDPAAMSAYVAGLPTAAFIVLLLGYVLGSFVAGFVMRKISHWDSLVLPLIVGVLGTVGWIANLAMVPHPIWVAVVGFFCYIPFAILGHRAAK